MSIVMESKESNHEICHFFNDFVDFFLRCRPTIKDCLNHSWLHDSYLKKLRRQTLTFTTTRLKEFLAEHQRRCAESATKHEVLLRVYQSGPSSPASSTNHTYQWIKTTTLTLTELVNVWKFYQELSWWQIIWAEEQTVLLSQEKKKKRLHVKSDNRKAGR